MNILENNGIEFVKDDFEAYVWLTTTKSNNIKNPYVKDSLFSEVSNVIASVEYFVPSINPDIHKFDIGKYWVNYTWVWKTLIFFDGKGYKESSVYNYIHYRMPIVIKYKHPPIPKFLYKFYLLVHINSNSVNI